MRVKGEAHKAPFLPDGAEDEVGGLFGNEAEGGLGALEEAFPEKTARTDGNLGLVDIVADAGEILLHAQQHLDAAPLVVLEHMLEDEFRREYQGDADDEGGETDPKEAVAVPVGIKADEGKGRKG